MNIIQATDDELDGTYAPDTYLFLEQYSEDSRDFGKALCIAKGISDKEAIESYVLNFIQTYEEFPKWYKPDMMVISFKLKSNVYEFTKVPSIGIERED